MISLFAIKFSFLLFYLKLFPRTFVKLRWALYIVITFTILSFFVFLVIESIVCTTLDLALVHRGIPPRCKHWQYHLSRPILIYGIMTDMFTDVPIYLLPMFILPYLNIRSKRKIVGLALTFGVGL